LHAEKTMETKWLTQEHPLLFMLNSYSYFYR
jgi:hypothetical protein